MVSSVPSYKDHQAGLVDTIGLQVVYSGAFGSTSQVSAEPGSCTRPATADHQQPTPMSLPRRARRTGARPDRRRGSQAASSNSSCRSIRAGAIGGARDGRPTPARYHEHRSPIGQGRDSLHRAAAGGAHRHLNLEHAGQQPSPFDPVAMPARVVGRRGRSLPGRRRTAPRSHRNSYWRRRAWTEDARRTFFICVGSSALMVAPPFGSPSEPV